MTAELVRLQREAADLTEASLHATQARNAEITRLHRNGHPVREIARAIDLSESRVWSIIKASTPRR